MVNGRIRVKKMIYRASNGKEIVFDAWEDNVNEYGTINEQIPKSAQKL